MLLFYISIDDLCVRVCVKKIVGEKVILQKPMTQLPYGQYSVLIFRHTHGVLRYFNQTFELRGSVTSDFCVKAAVSEYKKNL